MAQKYGLILVTLCYMGFAFMLLALLLEGSATIVPSLLAGALFLISVKYAVSLLKVLREKDSDETEEDA